MDTKKKQSQSLIVAVLVSFIIGGVSGGIIGGLTATYFASTADNENSQTTFNKQINIEENSSAIDVVKQVSPSVVSIVITKDLNDLYNLTGPDIFPFDDFFEFGFPYQYDSEGGQTEVGGGTGFIIDSDGLIMTNRHVVEDEDAAYTVITNSGESYEAELVGLDPFNDLAIIRVEASGLPAVQLADSDQIQIGQTVIAIGNTLAEYQNTVTKGVISGVNRTITAGDSYGSYERIEEAIQTDAAINPGNSGGPLLNLEGQVLGVNTAINREGEAIGFAIPINIAKPIFESIQEYGKIVRPMLGIRYRLITPELAEVNNLLVDYGALLISGNDPDQLAVIPGGPADKAGLEANDIILEFNGQAIDAENSLAREIAKYQVGDVISLKIFHDGEEKTVEVTLEEYSLE